MFRSGQTHPVTSRYKFTGNGEVLNHFDKNGTLPSVPPTYPLRLNFYSKTPNGDVTIEDFETWAIDRLRILAEIEAALVRNRSFEETRTALVHRIRKFLPLSSNAEAKHVDLYAERRKDHVGHFVIRLAFCRSEELRSRLIKAESILFRIRWSDADQDERQSFLAQLGLNLDPLSADSLPANIIKFYTEKNSSNKPRTFYKVKWTRVPDLVEKRRVYLTGGYALLPDRDLPNLIFNEFQIHLAASLEMTAKALPRLDDDRLAGVLEHLSMGFLAGISTEYSSPSHGDGSSITAEMVDELAQKHFPFCMRNLHDTLRQKKHLRYNGRQQYNLFLKGIGLSVEEAIIFWRRGFSNLTDDKFNKEYRYNIRHNYGLEGRRMNYPPKTCQRIIMNDPPGPQDSHGCPFRHFSETSLSAALTATFHIGANDQRDIMDSVKGGHYHVACTRLYEITHGSKKGDGLGGGESVTHPNLYFDRSRALEEANVPSRDGNKDVKMNE